MQNLETRSLAKENRVFLWQVAEHIGVSEPTITRWMRLPLPADKRKRIESAIREIAAERGSNGSEY